MTQLSSLHKDLFHVTTGSANPSGSIFDESPSKNLGGQRATLSDAGVRPRKWGGRACRRRQGRRRFEGFLEALRCSGAKIEAVATDMSPAYIEAVTKHLPQATLVFDRFHVIKLFNDKLSDLRRELFREATDQLHKDVLKGTRWLLLKRPENLDPKRNEPARLQDALRLNQPLATAYYLKEQLGEVWEQEDGQEARDFLLDWIAQAECSGIRMLINFAKTLRIHAWGILAYYDYPISTGPLEGANNKIKTMKRQAYGFRDAEFLKLKIYAIHESKYALVG